MPSVDESTIERHDEKTEAHPTVEPVGGSPRRPDQGIGSVTVTRGSNAGSRFHLSDSATAIGRHPDSGIFLDDVTVSRRHAMIRLENGQFLLSDVNSLNGTYVNGVRIENVELRAGDQLQVGKYLMLFDMEDE